MNDINDNKFKKSPSFTIRAKLTQSSFLNNPQKVPGPTQYTPEKLHKNTKNIKFTQSPRKSIFEPGQLFTPGPGQYENYSNKQSSKSLSKSRRKFQTLTQRFHQKQQTNPGPGAYDIKNDFKKILPKFSIGQKFKSIQQIQLQKNKYKPSPGAYKHENSLYKNQSSIISIPKQPRMRPIKSSTPGPGNYQIDEKSFTSQKSFGKRTFTSMKRDINFHMKNESPGPGRYSSQTFFQQNKRKSKGFSCSKLIQITKKHSIPGPGHYQSQSNLKFNSSISIKMPQAQRKTFGEKLTTLTPGPGKYQNLIQSYNKLKFKSLSAPKFSKTKLQTIQPLKQTSPQKFYDSKIQFVKKKSQSFSLGFERKVSHLQKSINQIPGPGNYNPEDKLIKQKNLVIKFPVSKRSNVILNSFKVGPGSYDHEKQGSLSKIGPKFSKSKRTILFANTQRKGSILRMSQNSYTRNESSVMGKLDKL